MHLIAAWSELANGKPSNISASIWAALLSGIVSAAVTAVVTFSIAVHRIKIENITQERCKWREKMRELANAVHSAMQAADLKELARLRAALALRLNPDDEDDKKILEVFDEAKESSDFKDISRRFSEHFALLLKHDWDRAKQEARFWCCGKEPPRLSYADWKDKAKIEERKKKRARKKAKNGCCIS